MPVRFNTSSTPHGYYVPNAAIILREGVSTVYLVKDGVAWATAVSLHENIDEYRRIEGKDITAGSQIILRGVNYVSEGQPVVVTEVLE